MKKIILGLLISVMLVMSVSLVLAAKGGKNAECATIKDGTIVDIKGNTLTTGYDQWGYNYQAHMFNGRYCDYDRVPGGAYCDVDLIMKWNDAWLSNKDCDGDGLLDRPANYIGSGAWVTNHMWESYEQGGETCEWDYFTKIVAAPADANKVPANANGDTILGIWYAADGTEIGPVIWGAFATIQSIYNEPCGGISGVEYLSPSPTGFGYYS